MRRLLVTIASCALALGGGGCNEENAASATDGDGSTIRLPPDSGTGGDGGDGGSVPSSATMRLVHLSPDLGAVDFCYRLPGSSGYDGPVLGPTPTDAGAPDATADASPDASPDASIDASLPPSDAGQQGLGFPGLTSYFVLPGSGTIDIALVAAGGLSCAHPIAEGHVTLDAGKRATVAVMGLAGADAGTDLALSIASFTDDPARDPNAARVRLLHAALAGDPPAGKTLLAKAWSQNTLVPLAAHIDPRHVSAPNASSPAVDALGYTTAPAMGNEAVLELKHVDDAGASGWGTPPFKAGMVAGSLHTGYLASTGHSALLLWCDEPDAKTGVLIADCSVVPAY